MAAALAGSGCFPTDEGLDPPLDELNFPTGLALGEGGDRLYVANSDFDLRYNGGVVQVLDTSVIVEHLPRQCRSDADCPGPTHCDTELSDGTPARYLCVDDSGSACGELGQTTTAERFAQPGACAALPLETRGLLLDAAGIGPFVADLRYIAARGSRPARLVMPVRGDATLHWADVEARAGQGPLLDCGQRGERGECSADHRRGDQSSERSPKGDVLPTEPFGIAVSERGDAIFVGHQSQGSVSVFSNTRSGPELQSVLTDLPNNPIGLAVIPTPRAARRGLAEYQPGVLVSYRFVGRVEPNVELLRYFDAEAAAPGTPYLHRARINPITTTASGLDSRGIAVDASARAACEAACEADTCAPSGDETGEVETALDPNSACADCLFTCAAMPVGVFLANRGPDSLLIGRTGLAEGELPRDDVPDFSDTAPLRGGVSRVHVANITNQRGELEPRVLVLAFDARLLFIFDPATRQLETHVQTGPGPQSVVVDEQRALAYVAHFTDSYIGVVDLDQRHASYGQIVLNVGEPRPPRSSK